MAAAIFFISDSAAQYLTHEDDQTISFDLQRALSGSVFGVVATVYLHHWWGWLESVVATRLPIAQHRLGNTQTKVFVDQGLSAPFYIYSYYVVTNFLQMLALQPNGPEAKSPQQILDETHTKARNMLWPTMLRHWMLWPFVHSFNFYFVPLHHRVLVQNLVLVGWSGYLSHLNSGGSGLLTPKNEIETTDAKLHEQR
jgi:protein Mpv17